MNEHWDKLLDEILVLFFTKYRRELLMKKILNKAVILWKKKMFEMNLVFN